MPETVAMPRIALKLMKTLLAGFLVVFVLSIQVSAQGPAVGDVIANTVTDPDLVRFTLITAEGYASFSVPSKWEIIALQSRPPVAVAAFFVPGPEKSSHSSNVSVSLIQPQTDEGKAALSKVGKSYEGTVRTFTDNGWECFSQAAHQQNVAFWIFDAKKEIADVVVTVRVAWPQNSNPGPLSDDAMKQTFSALLQSVSGSKGPYVPQKGDTVRHPTK